MSPPWTTTGASAGASTDEYFVLRSRRGGVADTDRLGGTISRAAGLPADGAAERCREPVDLRFGAFFVRHRTTAARALRAGRRPQHRLHRAQYLRRLHD